MLYLNMGPPNQHKGTYFCCYCGQGFDLVAKRIELPTPDDPGRSEMIVTIVSPS
jgi:hypothetical protein